MFQIRLKVRFTAELRSDEGCQRYVEFPLAVPTVKIKLVRKYDDHPGVKESFQQSFWEFLHLLDIGGVDKGNARITSKIQMKSPCSGARTFPSIGDENGFHCFPALILYA